MKGLAHCRLCIWSNGLCDNAEEFPVGGFLSAETFDETGNDLVLLVAHLDELLNRFILLDCGECKVIERCHHLVGQVIILFGEC